MYHGVHGKRAAMQSSPVQWSEAQCSASQCSASQRRHTWEPNMTSQRCWKDGLDSPWESQTLSLGMGHGAGRDHDHHRHHHYDPRERRPGGGLWRERKWSREGQSQSIGIGQEGNWIGCMEVQGVISVRLFAGAVQSRAEPSRGEEWRAVNKGEEKKGRGGGHGMIYQSSFSA